MQELGYRRLVESGFSIVATSHPAVFLDDGPTSTLLRQVLGAIAQFDRSQLVARLKAGRMKRATITHEKTHAGKGRSCGVKSRLDGEDGPMILQILNNFGVRLPGSLSAAARTLFEMGIKTKTGKPVSIGQVDAWLNALQNRILV